MKIQHLILTCDKNRELQRAIRETFASYLDSYLFMGDSFDHDSVAYLGLPTGYQYVPFKLAYLIMTSNSDDEFDFYFFQDDDTFVSSSNLKKEIQDLKLDPSKPQCLGRIFRNYGYQEASEQGMPLQSLRGKNCELPLDYPSGGAGFVITREGFNSLRKYLRSEPEFATAYNSDISIGFWMRNSGDFELIHSENFRPDSHGYNELQDKVTFHHMSPERLREIHGKAKL
jgi:hypothetical protein